MEAEADKAESTFAVGKYVCGGRLKELFEKSSLRNLKNFYHSRGSGGFPKENGGVSRQDRVAACRRQALLSEKGGRKLFRYFILIKSNTY